jgi:3',5'-cyclic AMP phosphodiesterase CpdA
MRLVPVLLSLLVAACTGRPGPAPPPETGPIRQVLSTRRIVVYGDSRPAVTGESFFLGRRDPVKERALIIEQIAREKPDLIIHSGDLVARGSSEGQWKQWDEAHRAILAQKIPFYPALGNHEYTGDNEEALGYICARFPFLHPKRSWYSIKSGPLLFLILDTNFSDLADDLIESQQAFFVKALRDADQDPEVRALIIVAHHPPYTNSTVHGPSEETRRRFADPAAKCAKFRLFVAGHVHNYERFLIGGVPFVVSGGGGAPQTAVRTSNYRTDPVYRGPEERPFHYLLLAVGEKKATVDVMMLQPDETWKSGDRFDLDF